MANPSTDDDTPRTRYFVYETTDGGRTLTLLGDLLADSSKEALRSWFSTPPAANGTYVAVSENARRLRTIGSRVQVSIADVPDVPADDGDSVVEARLKLGVE